MGKEHLIHLESVERRQFFAATPILDAHFGDAGHVALPSYLSVNGILATHGSIYVDAYNYKKDRRLIYKYSDAGVMDRAWGRGGYIVPGVNASPKPDAYTPLTMTYDARTRGLLLGFSGGKSIDVQRLDAAGTPDAGWGDRGIIDIQEGASSLTLGTMQPLAGKKLALVFQSAQNKTKLADGMASRGGAVKLEMLRLDRHGRFDRSFSDDGLLTAVSGHYTAQTATAPRDTNEPTFGDLQLQGDGGYRPIDTREQTVATFHIDGGFDTSSDDTKDGRTTQVADSVVVSADGVVTGRQSYTLHRSTYANVSPYADAYKPKLAVADGANGVVVLAQLGSGSGTSVRRLTPTSRSKSTPLPLPLSEPSVFGIFRNIAGDTFVEMTGLALPTVVRLNADLSLNRHFGTSGRYVESDGYLVHAPDDDGRLVVCDNSRDLQRLV